MKKRKKTYLGPKRRVAWACYRRPIPRRYRSGRCGVVTRWCTRRDGGVSGVGVVVVVVDVVVDVVVVDVVVVDVVVVDGVVGCGCGRGERRA